MMSYQSKTRQTIRLKFFNRHAFMASITLAKFHLSQLMVTLIFGIWASETPPGPGDWKDSKGRA